MSNDKEQHAPAPGRRGDLEDNTNKHPKIKKG